MIVPRDESDRSAETPFGSRPNVRVSLPLLDPSTQRPVYAMGPRSLASVRLLRMSVTDRCNLRCVYCMPEDGVEFVDKEELLRAEDFEAVAKAAIGLGIPSVKLTGGEPTIRRDLLEIVERIAALGPHDLSMTTNGLQLPRLADRLRAAGLDRLTLSLDSIDPDRYAKITGGGRLELFWRGVEAARDAGFERLKFNVVVLRGINDDEVESLAALSMDHPWTIRFIEYMPLGESRIIGDGDPRGAIVDSVELRERLARRFGPLEAVDKCGEAGVGPAEVWRLPGALGRVGFISAMSQPFCETCNRLRLTSTGQLRSCLFEGGEVDALTALRPHADPARLRELFAECVAMRPEVHGQRGNRAMSQIGG